MDRRNVPVDSEEPRAQPAKPLAAGHLASEAPSAGPHPCVILPMRLPMRPRLGTSAAGIRSDRPGGGEGGHHSDRGLFDFVAWPVRCQALLDDWRHAPGMRWRQRRQCLEPVRIRRRWRRRPDLMSLPDARIAGSRPQDVALPVLCLNQAGREADQAPHGPLPSPRPARISPSQISPVQKRGVAMPTTTHPLCASTPPAPTAHSPPPCHSRRAADDARQAAGR